MIPLIDVILDGAVAVANGETRTFKAGEFDVLVCRVKGMLHAVEDLCSHQDTPLCGGRLVGHTIICPKHNAQFDVRTGKHLSPPAYQGIARFDIAEVGQAVTVKVPTRKKPKDVSMGPAPVLRTR